jgi:ribosome-associated toxin RatA of RatAB toxin-antitoxin module
MTAAISLILAGVLALAWPAAADQETTFEVIQTGPRAYRARGSFVVATPADAAWEAITDYEAIPRIAPAVKRSRVVQRDGDKLLLEQEAVGSVLFFSKRLHLLLEVVESPRQEVVFRDIARRDFAHYEGFWTLQETADGLRVSYGLDVERAFVAPDFLARPFFRAEAEALMRTMREDILRRAATPAR